MKKLLSLFAATVVAMNLMASEVLSIDFTQGQGEWTIDDVELGGMSTSVWQQTSSYGMKATAYVDGTRYATESWLISPKIDLSNASSATLTFSQAMRYGQASQLNVYARTNNGSWNTLSISAWPDGSNWNFITSEADLSAFIGKKNVQIAFVYTSTTTQAGTWQIKNVSVTTVVSASYLTVSQMMTEYNNLGLTTGTTASGRYTVRGYVTSWFNGYPQNQYATFYIDDDEYGSTTRLQCFRLTGNSDSDMRTLTVGDYVEIQNAQLKNYNGQAELINGSYTIISDASPAQFMGQTSIANFISTADTKNIYQLKGVVSNIADNSYGNFDLVDGTGSIYIFGLYDTDGESQAFGARNIQEGDTVILKGVYYLYNSTPEIRNAILVEHRPYVEPAQFMGQTTIANFIETADTKNIYQLTGVVQYIADYAVGNLYIEDETGTLYINGLYDTDGQTRAFNSHDIQENDTITLKGTFSLGNQPQIVDAMLVDYKPYVEPKEDPVLSGQCGDNVYFSIDTTTMTITFTGTGAMWNEEQFRNVRVIIETEEGYMENIGISSFIERYCTSIEIASDQISYLPTIIFKGRRLESINVSNGNGYYSSQDGVLFDKNKNVIYTYPAQKAGAMYHVPNTVNKIDHLAFEGNTYINTVTMGNNVTFIGMLAFNGCTNLHSITLSENLSFIGYFSLMETAFYDDEANRENGSLYIGNNLIEIARTCIRNAYSYEDENGEWVTVTTDCPPVAIDSNYVVKEGTRTIAMFAGASDAFGDANWLKKVTIPASVEYVNFGAFMNNHSLEEIVWNAKQCHDFEDRIPYYEHEGDIIENPFLCFVAGSNTEMYKPTKKISFGKDVEYIPAGMCKDMTLLEEVYNYNPEPITVSEDMFANVPYSCILYVPFGSRTKYENTPVWRDFYRIREMNPNEGIESVNYEGATTRKFTKDGQIFILRGEKVYTLQGQEVK